MSTSRTPLGGFYINARRSTLIACMTLVSCGSPVLPELRYSMAKKGVSATMEQLSLVSTGLPYRGVSLAGAEFSPHDLPGTHGTNYFYPTHAEVDYFSSIGMTVVRIPFLWERLQNQALQNFNTSELARLDDIVNYASGQGLHVLLDPHNYARYYNQTIGSASVPNSVFANLWSRLATRYGSNSNVIFGLMNEPHDIPTEQWASAAQAGIDAIRESGAKNLILVPGNGWTGASSWSSNYYGTPNATVMLNITDPANNYAFEAHQYLDSDNSGTHPACISATRGTESMSGFTAWLRANGKRGFLGEFAGANNSMCLEAINDQITHLENNSDVYLGWAWWAAGPMWGNYMFSIEPGNSATTAITAVLSQHLKTAVGAKLPPSSKSIAVGQNGYPYCTNGSSTGGGYGWDLSVTDPKGFHSCLVPPVPQIGPNGYPYCTNGSSTGWGYGWDLSVTDPKGSHSCLVPTPAPTPAPTPTPTPGGLTPLPVSAAGNAAYQITNYGTTLQMNKSNLAATLDAAGATPQEKALVIAMAMQETTLMSINQRDANKDRTPSANVSILNVNFDMLTRLGYTTKDWGASLNAPIQLVTVVGYLLKAFRSWGIQSTLNYQRGGYTAFQDGVSYGAAEYRNAIVTIYNKIASDMALETDGRRIEINVRGV